MANDVKKNERADMMLSESYSDHMKEFLFQARGCVPLPIIKRELFTMIYPFMREAYNVEALIGYT